MKLFYFVSVAGVSIQGKKSKIKYNVFPIIRFWDFFRWNVYLWKFRHMILGRVKNIAIVFHYTKNQLRKLCVGGHFI